MQITAYIVNSFAKTIEGGNAAGVVLNADQLTEQQMLDVSSKLGHSETAFVMKSEVADFKIRFFTPTDEVDLCGHATIATFHTLLEQNVITSGTYTQETKAGVLKVEVKSDASIMMTQNLPIYSDVVSKEEIADSLNISVDQLADVLPSQIVSTGLRDIMVPIKSREIMNSIQPDFDKVAELSRKYDTIGYHLFTLESLHGGNAYCRNLAPLYGIPEESATGTSNGALASYLYHYKQLDSKQVGHIVVEQGYTMNKPSEIIVSLGVSNEGVESVQVGGKAIIAQKRFIELQ